MSETEWEADDEAMEALAAADVALSWMDPPDDSTGPRRAFLRAMEWLALADRDPSVAAAAAASDVRRPTASSWIHRSPEFAASVRELQRSQPPIALNPFEDWDQNAAMIERLQRSGLDVPAEVARISRGEPPSRAFLRAAFPYRSEQDRGLVPERRDRRE